jgi:hypothetical protein
MSGLIGDQARFQQLFSPPEKRLRMASGAAADDAAAAPNS